MKKSFLLLLFCIVVSLSAQAQFRLGAKVNLIDNKLIYIHTSDAYYTPTDRYTAGGGLVANYKITRWLSFQSEILYNPFHVNITNELYYVSVYKGITTTSTTKLRMQYLEIPLLAKFTLFSNYKVNLDILAGGFYDYLLSAKQETGNTSFQNAAPDYTRYNAGFSIGVGLSIMQQRMFFEIRTNQGLVNIDATKASKVNTEQTMYTVGYYLFRGKKK